MGFPLLQIQDLSISFSKEGEKTIAVKNISFTIERGEILALVGESGSGKSVTALSVLQLLPSPPALYESGKILFSDDGSIQQDILKVKNNELQQLRGNKVAMIFQEPMSSLNPVMSCGRQITEALLQHRGITKTEAKKKAIEWLSRVKLPEPEKIFNRYPHQLSGGQKQRVMIAMAMSCSPSLLICDEPTTALDVTVQKSILMLIKELQQELDMGVLFISHDLGVVATLADRALIMYKGAIVEEKPVPQIFQTPEQPYTQALLACRPALHPKNERLPVVDDFLNSEDDERRTKLKDPIHISHKDPLISVRNLSVKFPIKKNLLGRALQFYHAVDDVNFDIYNGETLGLVGESGCGKTTLGRTLLRLLDASAGSIVYKNEDITRLSKKQLKRFRKEVQLIFQDPFSSLNPRLSIGDAIEEPMRTSALYDSSTERKNKVKELLAKVSLPSDVSSRYPHEFSGGQRQRIVIARALSMNPGFLVCDESVSALDVSVQAQVLNLLNDLKADLGLTMLFISHDLSVVRYMCDRIMVMDKGKIVEVGEAEELYNNPKSDYTKRLIEAIPKLVF